MNTSHRFPRLAVAMIAVLSMAGTACGDDDTVEGSGGPTVETQAPTATDAPVVTDPPEATDPPPSGLEGELVGTFSVDAAECADGSGVSGSYFRMVQIGGTTVEGPFISNADSSCGDPTFSGLAPGVDGGLSTGAHQAAPDPAYDDAGNALADLIFEPVTFFAVAFGGATDPAEATPTISADDGVLSGDLSAFTAYYGGSEFNQGAPKPDGTGSGPVGRIDSETGAYVLEWSSLISGGSFDGFTGFWHLEGTFTPG